MSSQANTLYEAALRLTDAERAELAARLMESIDPAVEESWDEAWNAEIAKRIEELDSGKTKSIPWAEARRMIAGTTK